MPTMSDAIRIRVENALALFEEHASKTLHLRDVLRGMVRQRDVLLWENPGMQMGTIRDMMVAELQSAITDLQNA